MLNRKIDTYLAEWRKWEHRLPIIVKGARQIGKSTSIRSFATANYRSVIEVNFVLQPHFKSIFENGYEVDEILKQLSLRNPQFQFIVGETLIFFNEIQACPSCATCLKSFAIDGRYDVICSGSLMGISYKEIESVSVGYKEDYDMYSMDFEEFLWAHGYNAQIIDDMYTHMSTLTPFSEGEMHIFMSLFHEYMILGGMPAVVNKFIEKGKFSGSLNLQRQLLRDYEEDITKYAEGLDKGKIKQVYSHIPVFLAKDYKKFQISKIAKGARNREYVGTIDWLADAGIINICYLLENTELPLKGNYSPNCYKLYFHDTGLLVASLDDEAQDDLRLNQNFGTYKGALYENIVGEMLVKQGYQLYFYRNDKSSIEMDFFIRDTKSLIPVEVKANDNSTPSLNKLIEGAHYPDIHYGIKLGNKNIGFNGKFYTFPYFLTFLLKKYLRDQHSYENK